MPPFLQFFLDRPLGAATLYIGLTVVSWGVLSRFRVRHAGFKALIVTTLFMPVYAYAYTALCCRAWLDWGWLLPLAALALVLAALCLIGPRDRPAPRRIG